MNIYILSILIISLPKMSSEADKKYCDFNSEFNYCSECTLETDCQTIVQDSGEKMCHEYEINEGETEGETEGYCREKLTYKNMTHNLSDGNKKVAFRLDDVQDYFLIKSQLAIFEAFIEKKSKINIGIIGDNFGKDKKLVRKIDEGLRLSNIEIFSHGWDDTVMEGHPKEGQKKLLEDTNTAITNTDICNWRSDSTITYTPHQNQYDENTVLALKEIGYKILSSHWPSRMECDISPSKSIKYMPVGASTNMWESDKMYEGVTAAKSLWEVERQYKFCGFAVIMMHPQEFSWGQEGGVKRGQIDELEKLIDLLNQNGYLIQFMSELADIQTTYVPCQPLVEEEEEEEKEIEKESENGEKSGDDDESPVYATFRNPIFWYIAGGIILFCCFLTCFGKVYIYICA